MAGYPWKAVIQRPPAIGNNIPEAYGKGSAKAFAKYQEYKSLLKNSSVVSFAQFDID